MYAVSRLLSPSKTLPEKLFYQFVCNFSFSCILYDMSAISLSGGTATICDFLKCKMIVNIMISPDLATNFSNAEFVNVAY